MKILITIIGRCRAKIIKIICRGSRFRWIAHPSRRTCSVTIIFSSSVIHHLLISIIRFMRCFSPLKTIKKKSKHGCNNSSFYPRYSSCNKNRNNQIYNSQRQQMAPNELKKSFNVFFLNHLNFNPLCFGKIKYCKNCNQNRRIEDRDVLIVKKNRGTNRQNNDSQQIPPYKQANFLKKFIHDPYSNLPHDYCTTKKVNCL